MVKCNGCKYLDGYTEYGQEFLYCKHPINDKLPEFLLEGDLDGELIEKEHNCGNWCSFLVETPHPLYMNWFSQMLNRLGM